jgi:hypothetical protein
LRYKGAAAADMRNRWVFLAVSFIMIIYLAIAGIKCHYFNNYMLNYLKSDDLYIELKYAGWLESNEFIFIRNVGIGNNIREILKWEDSKIDFYKGGEYPFLEFRIKSKNDKDLNLAITIHHSLEAVSMVFSQNTKLILQNHYKKTVESKEAIDDIFRKISVSGNFEN